MQTELTRLRYLTVRSAENRLTRMNFVERMTTQLGCVLSFLIQLLLVMLMVVPIHVVLINAAIGSWRCGCWIASPMRTLGTLVTVIWRRKHAI